MLAAGLGGATVWVHLIKLLLGRSRPALVERLVPLPWDSSFPSAHTAQIVAFTLCAVLIVRRIWPQWWVVATLAAVALVVVVGASRLYLQVHYPTDVLAGIVLAGAWIALAQKFSDPTSGTPFGVIMWHKSSGGGEAGYHPLRKLKVILSGLRFAVMYDFSVAYKLVISAIVIVLALIFQQWIDAQMLLLATGLVLMAELFNSAIEAVCDFMEPNKNEKSAPSRISPPPPSRSSWRCG